MTYSPITKTDISEMLHLIKENSIDDLFNIIPKEFLIDFKNFNIPDTLSESEVHNKLSVIANLNNSSKNNTFIGGGAYDHYIPKIIDFCFIMHSIL